MSLAVRTLIPHPTTIGLAVDDQRRFHGGLMALSRGTEGVVLGRTVPDNQIFSARLSDAGVLTHLKVFLDPQKTTGCNGAVGFEDPTNLAALFGFNPFGRRDEQGMLLTATFAKPDAEGVTAELWYCNLLTKEMRAVLTPTDVMRAGLCGYCDMVKEGELARAYGRRWILFEYGDGVASHLGAAYIDNGGVANISGFWTAEADGSEHVSTAGGPIRLSDSLYLLLYNRRRNNEWGVAYMTIDLSREWPEVCEVSPDWLIRAHVADRGPDDQLIAFGSCVTYQGGTRAEVLYHINDNRCARQLIDWS